MKRWSLLFLILFPKILVAQDIQLVKQLSGRYDYVAIGNTMNLFENGTNAACQINTSSSASLNLNDADIIIAAYLYWAGSGDGDFEILLNENPIAAQTKFSDSLDANRRFFAAVTDVTEIVKTQNTTDYTVSELDVSNVIADYCSTGTNFAGWALVVIYENDTLPLNQLNIYEGLQSVPESLNITLNNLNVLDNDGAKIGFIAWEGDASLAVNESLRINGNIISNPPLNPSNNAFNGTNSFTGSNTLYNMDIDVYSLQDNITIGDETAEITLTSGQDFVMINNIITVLNSQLPDATIVVDSISSACQSRSIDVNYTIFNTNSTDALPANTPIAFYIQNGLVGTTTTQNTINIGDSETGIITINIDDAFPENFTLIGSVDDDGTGTGLIAESIEDNNRFSLPYNLKLPRIDIAPDDLVICDDNNPDGLATFRLSQFDDPILGGQTNVALTYHFSEIGAQLNNDIINNTQDLQNTTNPQTLYIRVQSLSDQQCFVLDSFNIRVEESPEPSNLSPLEGCDYTNNGTALFNLQFQSDIIRLQNPSATISYHETLVNATNNVSPILEITSYATTTSTQQLFVRVTNTSDLGCFIIQEFELLQQFCNITIPKIVTNNGDQINDNFTITGLREFYPNFKLKIFNRWGNLVYVGNKSIPDWNGSVNQPHIGKNQLPTGTYYYLLNLQLEDRKPLTGFIYMSQ